MLKILDNKLVTDDQTLLDILARVFQVASRALHALKNSANADDKDDDKENEKEKEKTSHMLLLRLLFQILITDLLLKYLLVMTVLTRHSEEQ